MCREVWSAIDLNQPKEFPCRSHASPAARKNAGLDVSDRILLGIHGDEAVREVVAGWSAFIAGETLAAELLVGAIDGATHAEDVDVVGRPVRIGLRRAAA